MLRTTLTFISSILIVTLLVFAKSNKDYTDYVDPFIGTGGHGHTFPGPTLPFGMIQLSPDTRLTGWDGCSGYHYSDSIIYGFSHTHLSGTGVSDYGDILFMPTIGKPDFVSGYINENEKTNHGYGSIFRKENETAKTGYYSVILDDYNIKAELSTTLRCGIHQYTFPKSKESNLIIDLAHRDMVLNSDFEIISDTEITGSRISSSWAREQHVYFYAKFSKAFKKSGILLNDTVQKANKISGKNIKAFFTFNTKKDEIINIKVGISSVSKEGAKKNFEAEIESLNFKDITEKAKNEWQKELGKIEIAGGSKAQKNIFYTAMYHSFIAPNLYEDIDGKYRGTDLQIHDSKDFTNYTVFSLWDTYRATHPLYSIIQQKRTDDFISTFLNQYENGGQLPVWELAANYTGCMIGYHSIPVIADAYLKGIKNYDAEKAFTAMKHSAELNHLGLANFKELGYIPANKEHESVSKALEYAYDDWCIAQMAKALNKKEDYKNYIERAQYYKNHFEPLTGFMRAKKDAIWIEPFDPREVNFNFTEANSWQYSFYVPQDISGFMKLLGGKEKLDEKLDQLFSESTETTGRGQADITGLIGQYAHGNEPSHHIAYLYNFVGKPWKTQKMVRKIMDEMYTNQPDGLIGNEDCGQMSSWFVLSSLGFYSVTPGSDYYTIGTPLFEKSTLHIENGKTFTILAKNSAEKNIYIQSATLNGKDYSKSYISHQEIMNGGTMTFIMGEKPNKEWATNEEDCPKTEILDHIITPAPFINAKKPSFADSLTFEINSIDQNAIIYFTTNTNENLSAYKKYTEPITIYKTTKVHFFAENANGNKSKIMHTAFYEIPKGISIKLDTKYAKQYAAGGNDALIDGIQGINDFRLGEWQGYQQVDLNATITLKEEKNISQLTIRFLQDINSWIFMPNEVEFFISIDGINYESLGIVNNQVAKDNWDVEIQNFTVNIENKKAKYIKVIGRNIGICPEGHKAAGYKAWIFADEIIIN